MPRKKRERTDADREAERRRYRENPEKFKAKSRARYLKLRDDPAFQIENRARANAWYVAHRDDPEFKALHEERARKWRSENRERHLAWRRDYRKRRAADPTAHVLALEQHARWRARKIPAINEMFLEAKSGGCLGCNEMDARRLTFHHLDRSTKLFTIGSSKYRKLHRPRDLLLEIEKCVSLCANCHLAMTREQEEQLAQAVSPIRLSQKWHDLFPENGKEN